MTDEEKARRQAEADAKLRKVRREVKQLDYDDTMARVPQLIAREQEYLALVEQIQEAAAGGKGDILEMLKKGRTMKIAALKDLNEILKLHRGKYAGIEEKHFFMQPSLCNPHHPSSMRFSLSLSMRLSPCDSRYAIPATQPRVVRPFATAR